jgi:hypothetical protein
VYPYRSTCPRLRIRCRQAGYPAGYVHGHPATLRRNEEESRSLGTDLNMVLTRMSIGRPAVMVARWDYDRLFRVIGIEGRYILAACLNRSLDKEKERPKPLEGCITQP